MSKQTAVLKIKREVDGFSGLLNGKVLDFDKISRIVEALHDELETLGQGSNQNVVKRRAYIAANDQYKGKKGWMGSSKLAKHFGVSVGSISVDRDVIIKKNIQPDPEVIKMLEEMNTSQPKPIKEPPIEPEITEEPAQEAGSEEKKSSKNKKNSKGKKKGK
ncbi:MAG: hypothetical protein FIB07_17095 [Candidatus Methanoperedens sp.]|nr:hypothetical protein [Candidatus Methanoperedens sp.]